MFCPNCGNETPDDGRFCVVCGAATGGGQPRYALICPRCQCANVQVQTVMEDEPTGAGTIILYILLAITLIGLFVLIPILLRDKKKIPVSYAVCQNCHYGWRL